MRIHKQIKTVNPNSFCTLDILTQHVSAKQEVITKQIGQKRNYYVSFIIFFNINHIYVLDPNFKYHKITRQGKISSPSYAFGTTIFF
jgi:hypothetical protein